jgi:hypothetical protein
VLSSQQFLLQGLKCGISKELDVTRMYFVQVIREESQMQFNDSILVVHGVKTEKREKLG